mmetsp:Transcript_31262/g.58285  ORF Transcript_31262/g.58285 Transcript_31262/m.58285 type:complete len:275 (+) Transcript_31262:79-903(+)
MHMRAQQSFTACTGPSRMASGPAHAARMVCLVDLVHERDYAPAHNRAIRVPIFAVLLLAGVLVAHFPVNEQSSEVDGVEVRDDVVEPARQTPRPSHDPVAEVVDVPRNSPPPAYQELGSTLGGQGLEVRHGRIVGVRPELVLLPVRASEDGETDDLDSDDPHDRKSAEVARLEFGDVPCLQGVGERNPGEVAEDEHKPEAIRGDVHSGEDGLFEPQRVHDVDQLEDVDEPHRVRDLPLFLVLCQGTAGVDHSPSDEPWSELAELLEVEITDPWI